MTNMIVVFRNPEEARSIKNLLVRAGHTHTYLCTTGAQAISQAEDLHDGIILCGYQLKDMMYRELHECMPRGFEMILLIQAAFVEECMGNDIVCLTMPLKVYDLLNTVGMVEQNIVRKRKCRREQPRERSKKEAGLILEAKLLLMERNHMTEEEAHRYIQKCSMDSSTNMVETAQMILAVMQ